MSGLARRVVPVEVDAEDVVRGGGNRAVVRVNRAEPDPDPPIYIYVYQGGEELDPVAVSHSRQRQAIAEIHAHHKDAIEAIEIPVGEPGEPGSADVVGAIRAADDVGLTMRLRLPS
jgi:hypothetical protein